jgi:hypothetical protein
MVTVILIGLSTMTALVWVLATTLARESAAEKRRVRMPFQDLPCALTEVHQDARLAA